MAWKRGVANQAAGEIRMGHIQEFCAPTSQASNAHIPLKIIHMPITPPAASTNSSYGRVNFSSLPPEFTREKTAFSSSSSSSSKLLYLHAHQHAHTIITCVHDDSIPLHCIALSETHILNSKVCLGENYVFTLFERNVFAFDGREGVIGNTVLRVDRQLSPITSLHMELRLRSEEEEEEGHGKDGIALSREDVIQLMKQALCGSILTVNDLYSIHVQNHELILRVSEIYIERIREEEEEKEEEDEEEEEEVYEGGVEWVDHYRGCFDEVSSLITHHLCKSNSRLSIKEGNDGINVANTVASVERGRGGQGRRRRREVMMRTRDDEVFPVRRSLLRPCIALTSVVQAGRGKYRQGTTTTTTALDAPISAAAVAGEDRKEDREEELRVALDSCTFDRVLLYLEHEARQQEFRFDPLLAHELLTAAKLLGISGLQTCCEKVLGSFEDRVRRAPIRLSEVIARNTAGHESLSADGRRSETLLLLSGTVLDVSRWLYEHPGGAAIIPHQALNIDCTSFFEIYHASKQSFLYLKEFYIGELAREDLDSLLLKQEAANGGKVSDGFKEQLRRVTSWRITPVEDNVSLHKSF